MQRLPITDPLEDWPETANVIHLVSDETVGMGDSIEVERGGEVRLYVVIEEHPLDDDRWSCSVAVPHGR